MMKTQTNGQVSIMFTSLFSYITLGTFDLQNQKGSSFVIVNMSAKFDGETHNGLVYHVHKLKCTCVQTTEALLYIPTATRCAGIKHD